MELRKDYVLNRWVVVAEDRKKRPFEFKPKEKEDVGICYFCPGNENLTPEEISRVSHENDQSKWKIRVIPNKFAAVSKVGDPTVYTHNKFYTFSTAFGSHEVIIESNDHSKILAQLPEEHIAKILKMYSQRISELSKDPNIKYVSVFKNHGKDAGASIVHSHSQIISVNIIPPQIEEMLNAIKKFDQCPYCEIVENEKKSYRQCFENETFAAFTPYASRFHYEIWIFPKKHIESFDFFEEKTFEDLAQILKKILTKLDEIDAPFNMMLYYSPKGEKLHFHMQIAPHLATWAGFEYEDNITINSISPEDAAKFYRGEIKGQR